MIFDAEKFGKAIIYIYAEFERYILFYCWKIEPFVIEKVAEKRNNCWWAYFPRMSQIKILFPI